MQQKQTGGFGRNTVAPMAAGIVAGVAATAVTVALSKKENQKKIAKVVGDIGKHGAQLKEVAVESLGQVRDKVESEKKQYLSKKPNAKSGIAKK